MAFKAGDKVVVAITEAAHAGTTQPGEFIEYANSGRYAYVWVKNGHGGSYRRRVPAKNVATAAKVKPLKKYEQLFGKDD